MVLLMRGCFRIERVAVSMDLSALGRYLRESREVKEITLEDAVNALRIRRPILEAFEQGDFSAVETPVQVRGLLRNYARFLDLEEERVLQYYEAAISPKRRSRFGRRRRREPELLAPRRITDTPPSLPAVMITDSRPRRMKVKPKRNWLTTIALTLVSLAALSVIVSVIYSMVREPQQVLTPTVPATAQSLVDTTITATFMPTSTLPPPTNTLDFVAQGYAGFDVRMEMVQRSWVRIVADDVEQIARILEPGEVIEFDASTSVEITAANASALRLTVNGQEQTIPGNRGQQVTVSISSAGITKVVEGEVSPTPSPTDLPSATPSPTLALPTETPTAVQVNSIGQPTGEGASITSIPTPSLPTPTSIFDDPVSPTPLLETANTTGGDTTTSASASTFSTAQPTLPPTASGVVLPIRATSADITPTKSN
jgi:cytoskeletal protein RodZ